MANTANISIAEGNIMVPVVGENGALMAYLLYPDPTGIVQEYSYWTTTPRPLLYHSTTTPPQNGTLQGRGMHNSFHGWAGQPFIHQLKTNIMATEPKKVTADRIKNDPVFERTRENMAEFSRSGKAAKLLRTVFREVLINATDKITHGRLVKVFSRIVATDPVNARGERTVGNGDLLQLKGFNFNERAGLTDTLYARCPVSVNRVTGQVDVAIPAFVPRIMVQAAKGTTHFRIVAATAAINFDTEAYEYMMQGTLELLWDHVPTAASTLSLTLPVNSPDTIVVALGVEFYQKVNTRSYTLKSGEFNATSIVKVDVVP